MRTVTLRRRPFAAQVAQLHAIVRAERREQFGRETQRPLGGAVGQPFDEAYCTAKFAVEGLMESLAPVAAAQGVTVCVVEPGAVATEFANYFGVDER